jgi:hypothetical protein
MVRLEWNALRVGDHVLVHDGDDAGMSLVPGLVALTDTAAGSNDIGIRITPTRVVRPSRLAVHNDPRDLTESCWRCDAAASAPQK